MFILGFQDLGIIRDYHFATLIMSILVLKISFENEYSSKSQNNCKNSSQTVVLTWETKLNSVIKTRCHFAYFVGTCSLVYMWLVDSVSETAE